MVKPCGQKSSSDLVDSSYHSYQRVDMQMMLYGQFYFVLTLLALFVCLSKQRNILQRAQLQ